MSEKKDIELYVPSDDHMGRPILGVDPMTGRVIKGPRMRVVDFPAWLEEHPEEKAMYEAYQKQQAEEMEKAMAGRKSIAEQEAETLARAAKYKKKDSGTIGIDD
ncbi:MAG: hypothetical protein FWD89_01335 [Firmicutes bacterium]|nr:hypothetical protein [Bacillota bacterium]MCL2770935.1 hypothetical protein [Bacillota bacterium]